MEMENAGFNSCQRKTGRVLEYDILRVIVTLLVLLGHCTYYRIVTPYGGCDYSKFTEQGLSLFYRLVSYVSDLIYLFHMPLYMALSGALFKRKMYEYNSYKYLISNKAKKLLIPFFLITIFYSVPLKYVSGYFSSSKNLIKDIFVGQILIQGNTHLWFLPTLFIIFIIIYTVNRKLKINWKSSFIVFFIASFFSIFIPINIVKQVFYYSFWFYLGFIFEDKRELLNKRIENKSGYLLLSGVVFFMTEVMSNVLPQHSGADLFDVCNRLLEFISAAMGCLITYIFSYYLTKNKFGEFKFVHLILTNSLGLYLYSDTLNYIILNLVIQKFGNAVFVTNLGSMALFFGRVVITLTVALGISNALKKSKIKYIC